MACYPVHANEQGHEHPLRCHNALLGHLRRLPYLLLLPALWLGLAGTHATAQNAAAPSKKYMNDQLIVLPIHIDPKSQSEIQKLLLYVKSSPLAPWKMEGTISPQQKEYVFKAPVDGEYYFTLVTVNKFGQPSVANVQGQDPQAVVVLDRQAPKVELRRIPEVSNGTCVQTKVYDDNPNYAATYVEYQTRDRIWRPLECMPGKQNMYCIPAQAAITGLVRVTAFDRCNNQSKLELHLQDVTDEFGSGNTVAKGSTSGIGSLPQQPSHSNPNNHAELSPKAPAYPPSISGHSEKVAMPPMPEPGKFNAPQTVVPVKHEANRVSASQELINHTQLTLNYAVDAVGPSGVGNVEVWITRDLGKQWQKLAEDKDRQSPISVNLPGDGLYGLSLVARNGLGFGGQPPKSGDRPDRVVEVDTVNPKAQLTSAELVKGTQPPQVLLSWLASDKNLVEDGINLYYAAKPAGPWNVIAEGVKNTGQYRWVLPSGIGGQLYFRVSAEDHARNVSISQTQEPTQLDDLSRPKVRIQSISLSTNQLPTSPGVSQGNQLDSLQHAPPLPNFGSPVQPVSND